MYNHFNMPYVINENTVECILILRKEDIKEKMYFANNEILFMVLCFIAFRLFIHLT
jgi:hypothetical protein